MELWVPPKPAIIIPKPKQLVELDRFKFNKQKLLLASLLPMICPGGLLLGHMWTDSQQRPAGGGSITTVNFTTNIGAPQADRHIVTALGVQGLSAGTSSVVVNGVTSTQSVAVVDASTGIQEQASINIAAVPTGQSVTTTVNFSTGSDKGVLVNMYALYGYNATAGHTITDNNSNPVTGSLNTTANCASIGSVFVRSNDASPQGITWSGLTEDGYDWYVSGSQGGSSASAVGTGSAISVSATFSGTVFNSTRIAMAAASYPRA